MAKINFIHGDLSGSIGDNTYSRNRSGPYVRRKASPVQPETPIQTLIRERMAGLSKAWGNVLTPSQRGGWNILAQNSPVTDVFGNSQNMTGINMFIKINIIRLSVADARLDDAPINLDVDNFESVLLTPPGDTDTDLVINFTPVLGANEALLLKGVLNQSPGVSFVENKLKVIGVSAKAAASPVTIAIPPRFGAVAESAITWIRAQRYNDVNGVLSPGIVDSAVATP